MARANLPAVVNQTVDADNNTTPYLAVAKKQIQLYLNRDIREIGEILNKVKDILPHGTFSRWVTAELQITPRTAQNYMNAATFLQGKNETVSHLPPAIIYRLASPTCPRDIVDQVLATAERGDRIIVKEIRSALSEANFKAFHDRLHLKENKLRKRATRSPAPPQGQP